MSQVADYMFKDIEIFTEKTKLSEIHRKMQDVRVFCIVTKTTGTIAAVITRKDIIRLLDKHPELELEKTIVHDIVDVEEEALFLLSPDDFMEHAREKFTKYLVSQLVVVDDKRKPMGILREEDIIRWQNDMMEGKIERS